MRVSKEDFDWAVTQQLISAEQATHLWQAFSQRHSAQPRFDMAHIAYYLGALMVLGAMSWFMGEAWAHFAGVGILVIACSYALIFILVGRMLWREQLRVAGGMLFTLAVCMSPLIVLGMVQTLNAEHLLSTALSDPSLGIWMAAATVVSASIMLYFVAFPFLTAPLTFSLWYIALEFTSFWLTAQNNVPNHWALQQQVSLWFGCMMILGSFWVDRRTQEDFAFWGYLFGLSAAWGSLTSLTLSQGLSLNYLLINILLLVLSVILKRQIFIIFGSIGVILYLGYLTYQVFANAPFFPFILTLFGLFIIFIGVQYQRHQLAIENAILAILPTWLKALQPKERG